MRFKLLQVDTLFPVPLCSFALPDAAAINSALEAEVVVRRASEAGLEVSNRGGWHSAREDFMFFCHIGWPVPSKLLPAGSSATEGDASKGQHGRMPSGARR